jgi:hypothetical protein
MESATTTKAELPVDALTDAVCGRGLPSLRHLLLLTL